MVDYVRKPIKKERLVQAFDKIRNSIPEKKDFIEWHTNLGKTIIFTEQIAYIKTSEIDSRNKEVILNDNSHITLKNLSFKQLLELLPDKNFAQINKKEVLALSNIKAFSANEIITNILVDEDILKLNISDVYRNSLMEKFGK